MPESNLSNGSRGLRGHIAGLVQLEDSQEFGGLRFGVVSGCLGWQKSDVVGFGYCKCTLASRRGDCKCVP